MDFFGLGFGEILLILVVILIIWGPGRLPEIARTLGKTMRAFRKATTDLTNEVTKELNVEEKTLPKEKNEKDKDKPDGSK